MVTPQVVKCTGGIIIARDAGVNSALCDTCDCTAVAQMEQSRNWSPVLTAQLDDAQLKREAG